MRDAPDADLEHDDGHHVGLEVVSVNEQRYLETRERVAEAAAMVERELRTRGLPTFVSIYFDLDAMVDGRRSDYRAWLKALPSRVLTLVTTAPRATARAATLRDAGIERVAAIEWEPSLQGRVGRGATYGLRNGETVIGNLLAKKHARLCAYREAGAGLFREQWLAIASLGPGSLEDGGFQMLLTRRYTTDFDRVLLIYRDDRGQFSHAEDVTPARSPILPTTRA